MSAKSPAPYVDPLEHTPLHTLLVNTNRLQAMPIWLVVAIITFNAALVAVVWLPFGWIGLGVLLTFITAIGVNWAGLIGLQRTGRSFGPDRPTVIALAIVSAAVLVVLGLFSVPWWLPVGVLLVMTAIVYYSTWVEPFRLGVTRQKYQTLKLKADAPTIRLLQIGDIHVERIGPRERHLNKVIAELKPDVIVFTGDFVNLSNTNDPRSESDIRTLISQWHAPLGVYCVSGTPLVEPLERVQAFTKDLDNLKLLPNQWISLQTPAGALNFLGLVVTHDMKRDRDILKKMMMSAPPKGLHVLLMHPPDVAPEANELGVDLYLCGHTHGGQIRLPLIGAIFSSSHLGNRFIMGRYELGRTTLYTARGVGLEGLGAPRARFMCPPEIVLWDIIGTAI
ncbi:MAG: metallophosphoesterase [Chloroflexi bacterium]|nr:metallophosphoesterase [Chloroflexota bacterium]MCC6893616.1 metallophosphoesterase [Anaerolineae bacterium]